MRYKMYIIVTLLLYVSASCFAGDGDYAVSKIPDSLMKNADVVMLFDEYNFEVVNLGKSVIKRKYAITIFN